MKLKFAMVLLIFFPFVLLSQEVIQESVPLSAEKKRINKVREEISALQSDFAKADEEFKKVFYKLQPLDVVLNPTREKLDKKLQDIEQTQNEMQRLSLKETCAQINVLKKSIGESYQDCASLQGRIKHLQERHKEIRDEIAGLQKKNSAKANDEIKHKNDLSNLDKEIASLDDMLANSTVSTPNKSKSLDDFLSETCKSNTTGTKANAGNSLDEMLSSSGTKTPARAIA